MQRKAEMDGAPPKLQLELPPRAYTYGVEWLDIARQLEDAHEGLVIVNPRNLQARSLLDVDDRWLADMAHWREEIQFWADYPKRNASMK